MSVVYSYRRFSTAEQRHGMSLARQTERAMGWLKAHPEHTLDTELRMTDMGVSGFRGKHRETGCLGVFLKAIENHRVAKGSILLVESMDRLSREEVEDALELFLRIVKGGVAIVILTPIEKEFRKGHLDMTALIIAIVEMCRSHQESERRADLSNANWERLRKLAPEKKISRMSPAWLTLSADRSHFIEKPEAVAIVRRIFRMVLDGQSVRGIVYQFNRERVPIIGRATSQTWSATYISKVLHNKATIGEFYPKSKNKPTGQVVKGYYPAIIEPDVFFAVQSILAGRRKVGGARGAIRNLFPRLVRDIRDGGTMLVINKGEGRRGGFRLLSNKSIDGSGAKYCSISYDLFEHDFLAHLSNLSPEDIAPHDSENASMADELQAAEGRLLEIQKKIEEVAEMMLSHSLDTLVGVAGTLEAEKREIEKTIETLRANISRSHQDSLHDGKEIIEMLDKVEGDELIALRLRLREAIRGVVRDIWINPEKKHGVVRYRSGGLRVFTFRGDTFAFSPNIQPPPEELARIGISPSPHPPQSPTSRRDVQGKRRGESDRK